MDDLLTGDDTVEGVIEIVEGVSRVLSSAGFNLRKWVLNSSKVRQIISKIESTNVLDIGENENTKTLGLQWNGTEDTFKYVINRPTFSIISKRTILSEVLQIFDPLGFLSPVVILAKVLLQQLWSEGIGWDDSLPHHMHTKWLQF